MVRFGSALKSRHPGARLKLPNLIFGRVAFTAFTHSSARAVVHSLCHPALCHPLCHPDRRLPERRDPGSFSMLGRRTLNHATTTMQDGESGSRSNSASRALSEVEAARVEKDSGSLGCARDDTRRKTRATCAA